MQSSDGAFSFYKKQLRQSAPHHT